MSQWNNTYTPEDIGSGTTISGDKPGGKIAAAITEIQEKAVTDVGTDQAVEDAGLSLGLEDGKITLEGEINAMPEGGEDTQVLQTDAEGEAQWGVKIPVPTEADDGKLLVASGGNYILDWARIH